MAFAAKRNLSTHCGEAISFGIDHFKVTGETAFMS